MAIFASTTTSGYSDPLKALSIKALEQRQKDMQAQLAAQQPDAAMMSTIPGGIGHVLGAVGDRMKEARTEQALAAQRDMLAKTMSGIDWEKGPDAQQIAQIGAADPETMRAMLTTMAENRRARESNQTTARGQDVTARGQDVGANVQYRGQDVTARGQDVGAATAAGQQAVTARGQDVVAGTTTRGQDIVSADTRRGQDVTARGQDVTARGQDIVSGDTRRGQDVTVRGQDATQATAERGQDITARGQDIVAGTTTRGQDVTARGQDIVAGTTTRGQDMTQGTTVRGQDMTQATTERGQDMTAATAARGQDVTVRGQDVTARGQDLANKVKMDDLTKGAGIQSDYARHSQALDNLSEARDLLNQGINSGFWGSAQTKAAQIAAGKWGTDKDAADRTARFNQLMDEQAITKMAAQLKGQTTNFEMGEFQKIVNNPNVKLEDRLNALDRLIKQANVDKQVHGSAATAAQKQIGGPTVEEIDATVRGSRPGGGGGGGGGGAGAGAVSEAQDAINRGAPYDEVVKLAKAKGLDTSVLKQKGQ